MKKFYSLVTALSASILLGSCGIGTNGGSLNQGNAAKGVSIGTASNGKSSNNTSTNNALGNSNTGSLINAGINILSAILGGGAINANSIVGTWVYAQPQVTFESTSVLGNIGGELMGNKIESALKTQLERMGLKQGVSTFAFDKAGNMTVTIGTRTTKGTYVLSGNQLKMNGALGLTSMTATVTISQNQLYMLFDANTIFNIISKLGSNSSSISSLLKNFNGMKMGWSLTR